VSTSPTMQQSLLGVEGNRVRGAAAQSESPTGGVNKVHRLPDKALAMAKMEVGGMVRKAIEGTSLKTYGPKSLISEVCSGEKVPEYLARIIQDSRARRRLGLALLRGDDRVKARLVIECDWDGE